MHGQQALKTKIYLDTTIVSALFDKRTPERMLQTKQFWEHITSYDVHISDLVTDEIMAASQPLQDQMLERVSTFTSLSITNAVKHLAGIYLKNDIFPDKYSDDAVHTAIASTNNIPILLSWNFAHLVKLKTRRMVTLINAIHNYNSIEIIAPPEL